MGQVDDEAVGLALHAADDHQGLAEVALRVPRRMGQRDEHLLGLTVVLPDVVLDRGVSAVEAVFVPEALEDALGGVALLPGTPQVVLQEPADDAGVGLLLSLSKGWGAGAGSVAGTRRHGVGQHLAHRVPVQTKLPGNLPNTLALHHHRPANPHIYVHAVHPSHHP